MRRQIINLAGAMALATVSLSSPAFAQAVVKPGSPVSFVTQQPVNEWLAGIFVGQAVQSSTGETVGDINDLVFNRQGHISTVVIGVGGFLGVGEKNVAVPFSALTFNVGSNSERVIVIAVSKEALAAAPDFKATEKTSFQKFTTKAAQKIEDMRKGDPAKK